MERSITARTYQESISLSRSFLNRSWGTTGNGELQGVINYCRITENAPDLLKIFHVEETEDSFFYTMEPADSCEEGEYKPDTLEQRLQGCAIPQCELMPILKGIFAGIKTIHNAGFAHRDIKPANILFVKGVPKLGDIGLLSSLSNSMTQLAGTLEFLPPELRNGDMTEDRPSRQKGDLYAFGKVMYCAVTGNGPECFPSVPEAFPCSLQDKLLMRLFLRLCNREPLYRIFTVPGIEAELQRIETLLLHGESLKEKLKYAAKYSWLHGIGGFILFLRGCRKHWILSLLLLLIIGGGAWYLWPRDPYEVKKVPNKIFTNAKRDFSITIPVEWEIVSTATLQKKVDELLEKSKKKKQSPEQIKMFNVLKEAIANGTETIYCSFKDHGDNISINSTPGTKLNFENIQNDEFRVEMKRIFKNLGVTIDFHEIKRFELAGIPCRRVDFSLKAKEETRALNYILNFGDHYVSICLNATNETYTDLRIKFESAMQTLKITKK